MERKEKAMTENGKKFLEVLSTHEELKERANKAQTKEEVMELAKELGVTLLEEDFVKTDSEELSEEELAAIAGGKGLCLIIGVQPGSCGCFIVGAAYELVCVGLGNDG